MGKKPFKSPTENQPRRSSIGSFVTVNSKTLSVKDKGATTFVNSDPPNVWSLPGYIWESKLSYDECCYSIILQAQASTVVVFIDEEKLPELAGTLRSLVSTVISVTLKTQRAQAAKALAAAAHHRVGNGCVIMLSPQMAVFAESCLPHSLQIKSIIHIGFTSPADFERRCVLDRNVTVIKKNDGKEIKELRNKNNNNKAVHVHIIPLIANPIKLNEKTKRYEYEKLWTSIVQRRVSTAKKLHFASIEGMALSLVKGDSDFSDFIEIKISDSERDLKKGISGKIEALRNKLKILMSIPLPGMKVDNEVDKEKCIKINESDMEFKKINVNSTNRSPLIDSSSTVREKMELLGMIALPAKGGEMHKLAETGRSLAATRWIDSVPLSSSLNVALCGKCIYPWGEVRYGASCDKESLKVRSVLNAFREYVSSKTGGKIPKRWEETDFVSKKLEKTLKGGRVVGFGWRPHIRGDEEWGGSYGKCCGHNEVVMFYCRPFMPLEVLNTHVCSKVSPAPGNEGYDGCLEFLQSQCKWFGRSMTVWDDKYFHYIGSDAVDRPYLKNSLLTWSVPRIRFFMLNMRYFTVQCGGQIDPKLLLDSIDLLLLFACGNFSIEGLNCGVKVQRLISSYLLIGTTNSWAKANKSNR